MIKKDNKLSSAEHLLVVKSGKRKHNSLFTVQFLLKKDEKTKCSVVIPKKVFKSAVKRNQIRRKIFIIIKDLYPHFPDGHHIVLILRSDPSRETKEYLYGEIRSSLSGVFDNK